MLEFSTTGGATNRHNYAYHINITGCPLGAGDIRLDYEHFYEGTPFYNHINNYLPKPGKALLDNGLNTITGSSGYLMKNLSV